MVCNCTKSIHTVSLGICSGEGEDLWSNLDKDHVSLHFPSRHVTSAGKYLPLQQASIYKTKMVYGWQTNFYSFIPQNLICPAGLLPVFLNKYLCLGLKQVEMKKRQRGKESRSWYIFLFKTAILPKPYMFANTLYRHWRLANQFRFIHSTEPYLSCHFIASFLK